MTVTPVGTAVTESLQLKTPSAVEVVGTECSPVVIFGDFAPRPDLLVDDAAMLGFAPMGMHYPGVRAAISKRILAPLITAVEPIIAEVFGYSKVDVADAFYSLVTTPPDALTPIQRLPHFDGVELERLALLHYLAPDAPGGTAFYRHRATGFETVTATRLAPYRAALESDVAREGLPEPTYIDGNTTMFEQIARFDGRFNRAILYRGNSLHCAWLPGGTPFDTDPRKGRLTLNTFLHCR